jgi:excisionase family DNA binding protein
VNPNRLLARVRGLRAGSDVLTAEQLADRWTVTRRTVHRWARDGLIPAVRVGKFYRFRLDVIETFEADGGFDGLTELR